MCRLPASPNASWDLVIVHSHSATVPCPACVLIFASPAVGRYQQLWQLVQSDEWQELHVEQYQYVFLPEGDVYLDVDQVERWGLSHAFICLLGSINACAVCIN